MKKRVLILLILLLIVSGTVFAQKHWVSAEINALGVGLRYEFLVNPKFTVGGYFFYTETLAGVIDFEDSWADPEATGEIFSAGLMLRWYPTGRMFFLELGLGYGSAGVTSWYDGNYDTGGLCLSPGFGFTIDIGAPGAIFLSPNIRIPMIFGEDMVIGLLVSFGVGWAF